MFILGGEHYNYSFYSNKIVEELLIRDAEPCNNSPFDYEARVIRPAIVSGNGKFKFQVLDLKFTKNEAIGKLKKPEEGMLILMKVRVANTSSTTMNIDNFVIKSADIPN